MKTKLLSLLAGAALVVTFSAAQAGEPQRLGAAELDHITAGQANAAVGVGIGLCGATATNCATGAFQKSKASSKVKIGSNGSIRVKDKAKTKSGAFANSTGGPAASAAVGVAATGLPL